MLDQKNIFHTIQKWPLLENWCLFKILKQVSCKNYFTYMTYFCIQVFEVNSLAGSQPSVYLIKKSVSYVSVGVK